MTRPPIESKVWYTPIRLCQRHIYDNAKGESFFKTFKEEKVYLKQYQTFEEASTNIGQFIDDVYNTKRLHSSLDMCLPSNLKPPIIKEYSVGLGLGLLVRVHSKRRTRNAY